MTILQIIHSFKNYIFGGSDIERFFGKSLTFEGESKYNSEVYITYGVDN